MDWPQLIQQVGLPLAIVLTAVVIIVRAGIKKVWVWGYQLQESEARAEKWERYAMRSTDFAEHGATQSEKLIEIAKELQVEKK